MILPLSSHTSDPHQPSQSPSPHPSNPPPSSHLSNPPLSLPPSPRSPTLSLTPLPPQLKNHQANITTSTPKKIMPTQLMLTEMQLVSTSKKTAEATVDSRTLDKLLLLCQKNSAKLNQISKRQDELETIIIEQKDKIDEILSKFEEHKFNTEIGNSKKEGKDKGKKNRIEFYQLFHEHKQLTDDKLKVHLKAKLDGDEYCTNQLQKLKDNDINYNDLWDEKLYSALLKANRIKKGDNWFKKQIKDWKTSKEVKAVYDDLYCPSNPNDLSSDTYIVLIIKSAFVSDKELMRENAV
ncbi:12372_t:CDS:2 [Funneliformis caledonium]|uniref:12372_t:CDS:1 n=1 Tax=Funneliformis caledonium TaxID=1117310 RepID=A0A9N9D658_9GLOM|nr:12372_t:CDS:2 [Funneliformis caledonium]